MTVVAILGILASFGLPLALVALVLYARHRKEVLRHETIVKLIERGLPLPPELVEPRRRAQAGLRAGLALLGLGVALGLFFGDHGPGWSIGLIPGLMGIALLVAWKIETRAQP